MHAGSWCRRRGVVLFRLCGGDQYIDRRHTDGMRVTDYLVSMCDEMCDFIQFLKEMYYSCLSSSAKKIIM